MGNNQQILIDAVTCSICTWGATVEGILEEAWFEDIAVEDLSENILPMVRMFYILALILYMIITLFGLKAYFVSTVVGYESYAHRRPVRYIVVTAKKLLGPIDVKTSEGKKAR